MRQTCRHRIGERIILNTEIDRVNNGILTGNVYGLTLGMCTKFLVVLVHVANIIKLKHQQNKYIFI